MKVTVIYGVMHKGSTYNCVKLLLEKMSKNNSITLEEFMLPRDMPSFCCGCFNCFLKGEQNCPHYDKMAPIQSSLENADIIILASPCYVYDVTGQMKVFLDHFGYRWMVHRPHPSMFNKIGVCISTTAGGGAKRTNETLEKSLSFWGVKRIFKFGKAVRASNFEQVNDKTKSDINNELDTLSNKILQTYNKGSKAKPSINTKFKFYLFRSMLKKLDWNKCDIDYWKEQGWFNGKKPF